MRNQGHGVEGAVGLPVASPVQPVPVGLPRRRRDGADAAEGGEAGLAGQPVGIAAGGDQQRGGDLGADAVLVQEHSGRLGGDRDDRVAQFLDLDAEVEPASGRRTQRQLAGLAGLEDVTRAQPSAPRGNLADAARAEAGSKIIGGADQ
jgi:hypothetical protein